MRRFQTLRSDPNVIAHALAIAALIFVTLVVLGLGNPAHAADRTLEEQLKEQRKEIETLKEQVRQLTQAQPYQSSVTQNRSMQPSQDVSTQSQPTQNINIPLDKDRPTSRNAAVLDQNGHGVSVSLDKDRPTFSTGDGQFSTSLRALIQYDNGWYGQQTAPTGTQLSNGSNFRRAQIGLTGTAFKDWSYNFTVDFGGSSIEKSGYIYTAYIEYDGLKPFGFRIGAYAPPAGLEDSTGSPDLIFLERPASADLARNIAGAPSRDSATVFAEGTNYFAAVSFTGGKVGDASTFEDQQALVGRLAYLVYSDDKAHVLLDADGTYVLKFPGMVAGPHSPQSFSFSITPELTADSTATKLVSTQTFDASHVKEGGLEAAADWKNLYAQIGYFGYGIERRASALANPNFNGWYALATWVITGESRSYDPGTATFRAPDPHKPLGSPSGFGALELAARYSVLDLNYDAGNAGTVIAANGVRGGRQDVWSLGLNWYPNSIFRFALDYELINVRRFSGTGADLGDHTHAIALRSQVSF
ncbi:MAG: hypothetical protein EPO08_14010 [Rhodospirillaceae bacterium]|nr:MAG: hypothetical protein EPO08_14010 [Rhodospirillaceae bacterium]